MKYRVEVSETVTQATVYLVEAKSKADARIAVMDGSDMERLANYEEDRQINTIISITEERKEEHVAHHHQTGSLNRSLSCAGHDS